MPAITGDASSELLPTGLYFLGLVMAEFNRLFHIKFRQKKV